MTEIEKLVAGLGLGKNIELDEMPVIDLYMDQVIQLFENKFADTKRNEEEKILTKTMINNYAKGELFFPIKKKKYTRNHLILISLIYQLKGGLSISDIKEVLSGINEQVIKGELELESFYSQYLYLQKQNREQFICELTKRVETVEDKCEKEPHGSDAEKVLLIASLVNMSNMYRRVAERLADQLGEENNNK